MVAADDDRRLDRAAAHELVEAPSRTRALAVAEPADPRGKPLVGDALAGGFDPADERWVFLELVDDRAVGGRDVRGVARQRDPAKRSLAFGEERPDVGGHEAGVVECPRTAAQPSLRAEAVAVVEHLRAAVVEGDHR